MPPLSPVIAAIQLTFTPIVTIGDWNIRLETITLAVVLFASLVVAARIARATPVDFGRPADAPEAEPGERNQLRPDDLLYIAVAALPGAVVGGRLGYGLLHFDYYSANPGALLDPSQGGLQLSLAVVGGTITAIAVIGLLGAPVARWMHALAAPLLLAIAAGKASLVLGGDGQGLPFDGPWATAYPGPGPWGSLAPAIPSHPAQLYEAIATAAMLLILLRVLAAGAFPRRNAGAFLLGVALWAVARAVVAATWRDRAAVGPLNADQVISVAIAIGALALLAAVSLRGRRGRPDAAHATPQDRQRRPGDLDWPDPETRPRF